MSKQNPVVSITEHAEIISARMQGNTIKNLAAEYDCSPDTISRILKKRKEYLDIFQVSGEDPKVRVLNPNIKTLIIEDDLLFDKDIEQTGDLEDGVIICDNAYNVTDSNILTLSLYAGDFGPGLPIKVGKVIVREKSDGGGHYFSGAEYDYNAPDALEIEGFKGLPQIIYKRPTKKAEPEVETVQADVITEAELVETEEIVWNASSKFISIFKGTTAYNADKDHENFKEALQALIDDDLQKAIDLINIEQAVKTYVNGNVRIEHGNLYYKDITLKSGLVDRILKSMDDGEDFEKYLPFLENLMLNPSNKAVRRLFDFLVANDIEITDDGYFIAWKYVNEDYLDCHTKTFDNSPGQIVRMARNLVDEDDNTTCSHGLHVCSKSYLPQVGNYKIVSVLVHPRDVVSIPVDYNDAKMRTCRYEVLADVTEQFLK